MTDFEKAKALFAILDCAPMGRSRDTLKQYADSGDVEHLWQYYSNAMSARPDVRRRVESSGEISFEMLRPAMEAVYALPSRSREELL